MVLCLSEAPEFLGPVADEDDLIGGLGPHILGLDYKKPANVRRRETAEFRWPVLLSSGFRGKCVAHPPGEVGAPAHQFMCLSRKSITVFQVGVWSVGSTTAHPALEVDRIVDASRRASSVRKPFQFP
jgi:hypothetical protein